MYGILGSFAGFDLQSVVFITWVIFGVIILLLMLFGMWISLYRLCWCHWLFAILMCLFTLFFLVLGAGLIAAGKLAANYLDELWSSGNSSNTIQKSLSELYSKADSIYCVASNGCTWYATYVAPTSPRTYVMTAISSSSTVTSVQGCKSYLQTAYKDYGISFSDIDAIIKYLNYFGEIEKGYTCSGVWTMMPIYYFSDCSTTKPSKKCQDSIRDDILLGEVVPMGIGFLIIGCILFLVWFIQYGLCCRK